MGPGANALNNILEDVEKDKSREDSPGHGDLTVGISIRRIGRWSIVVERMPRPARKDTGSARWSRQSENTSVTITARLGRKNTIAKQRAKRIMCVE